MDRSVDKQPLFRIQWVTVLLNCACNTDATDQTKNKTNITKFMDKPGPRTEGER